MMLKWILFTLLWMIVSNHTIEVQYPGARLIVTSKALDYGNGVMYIRMHLARVRQLCQHNFKHNRYVCQSTEHNASIIGRLQA